MTTWRCSGLRGGDCGRVSPSLHMLQPFPALTSREQFLKDCIERYSETKRREFRCFIIQFKMTTKVSLSTVPRIKEEMNSEPETFFETNASVLVQFVFSFLFDQFIVQIASMFALPRNG